MRVSRHAEYHGRSPCSIYPSRPKCARKLKLFNCRPESYAIAASQGSLLTRRLRSRSPEASRARNSRSAAKCSARYASVQSRHFALIPRRAARSPPSHHHHASALPITPHTDTHTTHSPLTSKIQPRRRRRNTPHTRIAQPNTFAGSATRALTARSPPPDRTARPRRRMQHSTDAARAQ